MILHHANLKSCFVTERSPQKPDLHAGLQANRIAVVGSDVEFVCAVMGDPQPYIRWFKHIVINGSKEDIDVFPFVRPPKVRTPQSSSTTGLC